VPEKAAVIIPTYNENQNISALINNILNLRIDFDLRIFVVDDDSPDLTWKTVERISRSEPKISLVRRMAEAGRGSAGMEGFQRALQWGADYIVEMDGDLSHDPVYIPELLNGLKDYDAAIGSRFVRGGKDSERSFFRRILSLTAGYFIKRALALNINDPTSGFRAFRRDAARKILDRKPRSSNQSIIVETNFIAARANLKIKEIPIIFYDRKSGRSKLGVKDLLNCIIKVFQLIKLKV